MTKKITAPAAKSATKAVPVVAKPTAPAAATPVAATKPAPAAVEPKKIDARQLQALQEFKDSVAARGGIYSVFEDQAGFESR
jgi:hypothetical protein